MVLYEKITYFDNENKFQFFQSSVRQCFCNNGFKFVEIMYDYPHDHITSCNISIEKEKKKKVLL